METTRSREKFLLIRVYSMLLLFLLSVIFVTKVEATSSEPFDVRLYSKVYYEGRYVKIKIGEPGVDCTNLPDIWDNKIASVDPLGCVILYAEPNCKGLRRRLERWSWGSTALKDISFENTVSSLSPCPAVKKMVIHDIEL